MNNNSYDFFYYHFITYWSLCFLFFVYDYFCDENKSKINNPSGSYKIYKINWNLYKQSIIVSLQTQLFIFMPVIVSVFPYYNFKEITEGWDLIFQSVKELFIATIIEEFYFYYTHRLLHNVLWKHHAKHHELITTVAVGTLNSSVIENIISNLFPILIMPFIINMSYITAVIWTVMATISAVTAHCGFIIFNNLSRFHSLHHLNRTCNYGVLGLADHIHGTYIK